MESLERDHSNLDLAARSRRADGAPSHAPPGPLTPQALRPGACPICDAPSSRLWSERMWRLPSSHDRFGLAQCPACEAIFCTPRPTAEQLQRFYMDHYDYTWFEDHARLKRVQGWHRWRRVRSLLREVGLRRGRLLDIGCGHGFFLSWAERNGWEVLGIDYPSRATTYARDVLGVPVIEGDLAQALQARRQELGAFDLATLWHCLEHAADPRLLLERAIQVLKDPGRLLVAVPNGSCAGMRGKREDWVWCQEPYVHTVHFTPRSLQILAERIGLRVIAIWSRDTWDANRLFDLYLGSEVRRITRRVSRISRQIGLLLEEGARLGCYAGGAFRHWCLGHEAPPDVGSELLLLAERKAG